MKNTYDVIVAGGGTAGICAAVAAARNGAKTLLIEQYGDLGGTATFGLVPTFAPFSNKQAAVIGGIGREILDGCLNSSWKNPSPDPDNGILGLDWMPIDPEVMKSVTEDMVRQSGVDVWLNATVTGVKTVDCRVREVDVYFAGQILTVEGQVFVDCTGDANLVAQAGGEWVRGDENGTVQSMTLCFRLAGVDTDRLTAFKRENGETDNLISCVRKARENGDFPKGEAGVNLAIQAPGIVGLNFGHIHRKDPLDVEELSQAQLDARKNLPMLIEFFHKYVPGMEHCYLASSGTKIGIRESRRIVGEYVMTRRDYNDRRRFPDAIAKYCYPIDLHSENQVTSEQNEFKTSAYQPGEYYEIPFRALLPRTLRNVIAAGRCISSDRAMNGSVRVMPACFATGQAAGTAAAMAVKQQRELKELDVKALQSVLRQQGAEI